ncbi:hypothetical protein M0R72_17430 [Candidatus Pacearchaeota archaeon]|jgi:hypothetical protein|nr:hypothetical protein [Candidatus Pacearchaeota archaeon]
MKGIFRKCSILWLMVVCAFFVNVLQGRSQGIERIAFGGAGYFAPVKPNIQAFAGMAIPLTQDLKTLSYTDFDISFVKDADILVALPALEGKTIPDMEIPAISIAGKKIRYSIRTGIARQIISMGKFSLYGLGAPGIATDGENAHYSLEYGGLLHYAVSGRIGIMGALTAEHGPDGENLAPRLGLSFRF